MRWLLLALLVLAPWAALAQQALPDDAYEDALLRWALELHHREREEQPEGKRIEEILVASEDIISQSDPYPNLLNWTHVRTREHVVRREVLLAPGAAYRGELAEETERNLRKTGIFAVARVVPVRGAAPDAVGVLVVTKDVWSLRFNSSYNMVGSLFLFLRLRPSEQNFLGLNKQVSLDYILERGSVSFGQIYTDRRVLGTRLVFQESAALIFNRQTWALEGSRGGVHFGRPLYAIDSKWGFAVSGDWSVRPTRRFVGFEIEQLAYPSQDAPTGTVPYRYDSREAVAGASLTRSFGRRFKANLTASVAGYTLQYRAPTDGGLDEAQRAWLEANHVPRSEDALYLAGTAELFDATYAVLKDRETFALSEDFQLGHSLYLRLRWASPLWGSPARFVDGVAGARYRWLAGENLLAASVVAGARYQSGLTVPEADGPWVNRRVVAQLEETSPTLGIGRLVFRALLDLKFADLSRDPARLGSGNGLRGVSPERLSGSHMLLFNLEYRTRSIQVLTVHLGLVFFYDAGSAFERGPQLVHSLGVGLRALFPQFDREPFRFDFAWSINGPPLVSPLDRFSASFGQATQFHPSYLDNRFAD